MKKVIMSALAFLLFATAVNAQDVKKTDTTPKPQTAQPVAQPQQGQSATDQAKATEATNTNEAKPVDAADKKADANQQAPQNQAK